MVIDDLDLSRTFIGPDEANPELIVQADAVLTGAIPAQCFQAISWRRAQERQGLSGIELLQLAHRDPLKYAELLRRTSFEQRASVFAAEREDHRDNVLRPA